MIKRTYFYDNFFLRFFLKANLAFHSLPETTNHESGLVNEIQSNKSDEMRGLFGTNRSQR